MNRMHIPLADARRLETLRVMALLHGKHLRAVMGRALTLALLLGLGAVFALPLLYMVSTSLKADPDVFANPPIWIPHRLHWENYPDAYARISYFLYMRNTLFIAAVNVVGTVMSCSFVAYGFARLSWPGRNGLFLVVLATMILPFQVTMIPRFIIFSKLDWINTYYPLTVPAFLGTPFFIFLLRQFFLTIPLELSDAARLDGCSEVGIWWRIILPLAMPALVTVAIFQFLASWNDFLGPLIYLSSNDLFTLSLGLYEYQNQAFHTTDWTLLMAASVTMTVPVIAIFFIAQKHFVRGITLGGIKG